MSRTAICAPGWTPAAVAVAIVGQLRGIGLQWQLDPSSIDLAGVRAEVTRWVSRRSSRRLAQKRVSASAARVWSGAVSHQCPHPGELDHLGARAGRGLALLCRGRGVEVVLGREDQPRPLCRHLELLAEPRHLRLR